MIKVPDFGQVLLWIADLFELASIRLGGRALLLVNRPEDDGIVAMLLLGAIGDNNIALNLDDGNGCKPALGVKHLRHSYFLADKP